ncbi:hypothetical protein, partial [Nocardia sp. JMUB6875]|uniref:hypothetical protein n=1 Tax=Nocardia sp. JMUB6875 TaxID=3158170 RepID=UPI0034E88E73
MSQSGAEHEQTRIAERGTDPDYVQHLEDFDRLSHEQIHHRVQAMNPGEIHTAAQLWVSIADSMFGALSALHVTVQSALSDGMSGHIADAAAVAARQFVQDATDIAEIANSTGHRLTAAAYGAEAVRKTVPPPMTHGSPNAREEQRQIALAALDANYTPIYPPAGAGVPAFFTVMTPGDGGAQRESLSGADGPEPRTDIPTTAPRTAAPDTNAPGIPADLRTPRTTALDTTPAATDSPTAQNNPGRGTTTEAFDPTNRFADTRTTDRQYPAPSDIQTKPTGTTPPGGLSSPSGRPTT